VYLSNESIKTETDHETKICGGGYDANNQTADSFFFEQPSSVNGLLKGLDEKYLRVGKAGGEPTIWSRYNVGSRVLCR